MVAASSTPLDLPVQARSQRSIERFIAMIGLILSILVIGLLAGALARLLVPGRQNISVVMTIVLGVVGSFVGGFLGYLLFGKDSAEGFLQPSGILGSVIGAVVVLLIWISVGRRSSVRNR